MAGALTAGQQSDLGRALVRPPGCLDGPADDGGPRAIGRARWAAPRCQQLGNSRGGTRRAPTSSLGLQARTLLSRAVLQRELPVHGREFRLPPRYGCQVLGRSAQRQTISSLDLQRGMGSVPPPTLPDTPHVTPQCPRAHCIAARQPRCLISAPLLRRRGEGQSKILPDPAANWCMLPTRVLGYEVADPFPHNAKSQPCAASPAVKPRTITGLRPADHALVPRS